MSGLVPTPKPRLRQGSVRPPNEPQCIPECGIGNTPGGLHYRRCPWYEYAPLPGPRRWRVPLKYKGEIVGEAIIHPGFKIEAKIDPEAAKRLGFTLHPVGAVSVGLDRKSPYEAVLTPF